MTRLTNKDGRLVRVAEGDEKPSTNSIWSVESICPAPAGMAVRYRLPNGAWLARRILALGVYTAYSAPALATEDPAMNAHRAAGLLVPSGYELIPIEQFLAEQNVKDFELILNYAAGQDLTADT